MCIHVAAVMIFLGWTVYLITVNNLAWVLGLAATLLQLGGMAWTKKRAAGLQKM
jgi:uncharacterized membrane protein